VRGDGFRAAWQCQEYVIDWFWILKDLKNLVFAKKWLPVIYIYRKSGGEGELDT